MSRPLFTVGHSSHESEYFFALLKKHDVTAVSDVRSMPYSRYNPQFNRDNLKAGLREHGIKYVFLGEELGARSQDSTCYVDGQARYDLIAKTDLFRQGLERVVKGSESFRIALMCAEGDPLTCHRTVLVCRRLKSAGLEINHILRDGKLESQSELERRLLKITGLAQGGLLDGGADPLDQAYEKQGLKIAYVQPKSDPDSPMDPELPGS